MVQGPKLQDVSAQLIKLLGLIQNWCLITYCGMYHEVLIF